MGSESTRRNLKVPRPASKQVENRPGIPADLTDRLLARSEAESFLRRRGSAPGGPVLKNGSASLLSSAHEKEH
jgi:hypothetical protein